MSEETSNEPMLDMYIFETSQFINQLETIILDNEEANSYSEEIINEIFRIMHTIKGSSAMMLFNDISTLAHSMEDIFYFFREQKPQGIDYSSLSDLLLNSIDFIKVELQKIKNGDEVDGKSSELINENKEFLKLLKECNGEITDKEVVEGGFKQQYYIEANKEVTYSGSNSYKAVVFFEDDCEMENIRAYTVVSNINEFTQEVYYLPSDIIENDDTAKVIREEGFKVFLKTDKTYEEVEKVLNQTVLLKKFDLTSLEDDEEFKKFAKPNEKIIEKSTIKKPEVVTQKVEKESHTPAAVQEIISVNVKKLDKLLNLVGEMVIAEAMVVQNPDLNGLQLDNFQKSARQLHKITSEMQDIVMEIRMVPLATTFHKMNRIVRDMKKSLNKEVKLKLIGENTEVDKNIIEHIGDPLMHLVRNCIDHGIESKEQREKAGKSTEGTVTIEAKNSGSYVIVTISDDGAGLNKDKLLEKAQENGILTKPKEEMTDREIYNLIFLPGFSTKEKVTEFSGRGVGMDVVSQNLSEIGGQVYVDSNEGKGSTFTLKIPLTLAIIDGMNVRVGNSYYTIPIANIKQSLRPRESDIIKDIEGNEMIMMRGECHTIIRIHEMYDIKTEVKKLSEGILIMVNQDGKTACIFADELVGQQQVVIKALPEYIRKFKKVSGLSGCTLLGDGNISLIIDVGGLISFASAVCMDR
ncbi:chemotaxis protein CheA [Clostridium hydrogenum]|uniref:chemotaxis protein CheA n=1 Tax=Clostridium hydrogenum TaxID=2855764 RepID=UPI001F337ACA|nr:chemotaxis protein CheA [Clostridium hydrogenum]